MTDIHCHILHEMDDGPSDIATALRLCETALNNGIDKIFATPHLTAPEDIDAFIRLRTKNSRSCVPRWTESVFRWSFIRVQRYC
jgi:tyrosine-protein phosphatase YwqE